ncbi:MAG: peptidoglycan DD-metalloendopeptidase family protein [Oscillospiraceae bacterium]
MMNKNKSIPEKDLNTLKTKFSLNTISLINRMERLSQRVENSSQKSILKGLVRTFKDLLRMITSIFKPKISNKKMVEVKSLDKKKSKEVTTKSIENIKSKAFKSIIRYCVPMLSVGFLISSIRYTASLEYGVNGVSSTYTSQEDLITVTQIQTQELNASITLGESDNRIFPRFSFSSIEDDVNAMGKVTEPIQEIETPTITTIQESSITTTITTENSSMCDGFGVFLEDEFLGAVSDTSKIENALNDILNKYLSMENVTEAHFNKEITYSKGTYSTEYMLEPDTIIKTLSGNAKEDIYYTIEDGDNLSIVAEISNLPMEEILKLNPQITNPNLCRTGDKVLIQKAEPFLDVEYTKTIIQETEIRFDTITKEDNSLAIGESRVITNGENGIIKNVTEVKYLNDVQISSNRLEPQTIKEPVSQVIMVGTAEPIEVTQEELPSNNDIAVINSNVEENPIQLDVGEFISPIESGIGYISDRFISNRNHKGLDIAAPYGTPIRASSNGIVVASGWNSGGYGYFVMIDHENGYNTLYAHMSEVLVTEGQQVFTGETIGKVGSTGNSTGNHLHFEVRYNNVCQNPENHLIETP